MSEGQSTTEGTLRALIDHQAELQSQVARLHREVGLLFLALAVIALAAATPYLVALWEQSRGALDVG